MLVFRIAKPKTAKSIPTKLKIPWEEIPVPVRPRSAAVFYYKYYYNRVKDLYGLEGVCRIF